MTPRELTLKLERARDFLFSRHPFYGALAMRLADTFTPEIPTAATDGRGIKWNPDFLATLTDEETRFVIAHETLHCAHGHLWRLPADKTANLAADYEIAETLANLPGLAFPAIAAALPGEFPNMACEEIDKILRGRKQQQQQSDDGTGAPGGDGGDGPPGPGDFTAPAPDGTGTAGAPDASPGATPGATDPAATPATLPLRDAWEQAVQSAAQVAAAGCGELPGDLARLVSDRARVKVDWRTELAAFLKSAVPTRTDYTRSARRMATAPVIYPRRRVDTLETVAIVRDTSGSISGPILAAFNDCVRSLAEEMNCAILLIDADRRVQATHEVPAGMPFPETAAGGGGTDFRPAFAEIRRRQESGENFAGLVYLTDLEGPEPSADDVTLETLWMCTTSEIAATGRTVRIEPATL